MCIIIYLHIARFTSALNLSLLFFFFLFLFRDDGMPTDVAESSGGRPSGVLFCLIFFSLLHGIKGRFPPLHGPRIYLILVLFFIFFSFFSFLLLLLYLHARARHENPRDTRARFMTVIMLFFPRSLSLFLSMSISIFRYSHYRNHHPSRLLVLSSPCAFLNRFADTRSIET